MRVGAFFVSNVISDGLYPVALNILSRGFLLRYLEFRQKLKKP